MGPRRFGYRIRVLSASSGEIFSILDLLDFIGINAFRYQEEFVKITRRRGGRLGVTRPLPGDP